MKKAWLLAAFALFCIIPRVFAQNKQLVLYTWQEMFPPEILAGFEKETGIKIVYETFDTNENMLLMLESTGGANYDLVIADDYILQLTIEEGLAQKLNKQKLSNFGNIDPFFQHQFYDPADDYTVPYGAGVQTIVYDPAKVKLDIKGYADLWDASFKGRLGIIGNYRVINGMALKVLGKSYNTEELADIRAAGVKLKNLAPNIRVIEDTGLDNYLIDGSIAAAVMYNDQMMRARQQKTGLKVVYPAEGIGFGIMAAFIPAQAANADGAHRFLNYILDAKRGAQCFEHLGYYCTYLASQQHISAALKEHLVLPGFRKFEMIQNFTVQEAENEHVRIWGEFNAAVPR
jgi:spermidine/putrescine-binding protein